MLRTLVSHNFEKVCGLKSLLIMKTDPYTTILVIYYWRSQNIHMLLKVVLLFHLCERHIKEIISRNVKKKEIAIKETLSISKEEEQILYYVSGYIIFSMIEKYKRIINNNEKYYCLKRRLEIFKFLENNMF